MSLTKLIQTLDTELKQAQVENRYKAPERVICGYIPAAGKIGPRYKLVDQSGSYFRMNSNSYLSLSNDPELIAAADEATKALGVGPGAVRFIDGTFSQHVELEQTLAKFIKKESVKIFNSAYTSNCGLALSLTNKNTYWVGDELNHNSIIRGLRISGVSRENKGIYKHNDMADLERILQNVPSGIERVVVVFDGVFSMRGDHAKMDSIIEICKKYDSNFKDGVITVVDDSHGIGAYGKTGRGTCEYTGTLEDIDIIVGTLGKSFGVNGGFIASSKEVIDTVRQKADTYIYSNSLGVAECAAATRAVKITDSPKGLKLLKNLEDRTAQFRSSIESLGIESVPGATPIVPLLLKDPLKVRSCVDFLFKEGILVTGMAFPVVPKGQDLIRCQINAAFTEEDINLVVAALKKWLESN